MSLSFFSKIALIYLSISYGRYAYSIWISSSKLKLNLNDTEDTKPALGFKYENIFSYIDLEIEEFISQHFLIKSSLFIVVLPSKKYGYI